MKELETYLNTALVNLCSISVSGPAVVPMGRAVEAINTALELIRTAREKAKEAGTDETA